MGDVAWTNITSIAAITGGIGAKGLQNRGAYNALTAYVVDDVVTNVVTNVVANIVVAVVVAGVVASAIVMMMMFMLLLHLLLLRESRAKETSWHC